jgi:HK97 family phage major capsid protein
MKTFEENVTSGFKAVGEKMALLESECEDQKRFNDDIRHQVKMFRKMSGRPVGEDKNCRGFWPNEEMAKEFGGLVLKALGRKAMGESTNVGGGFLVPDEMKGWIIQKLGQYGKYRQNATVVSIGGGTTMVPKVNGDLTVYCLNEGGTITQSDMSFGQVNLNPKSWACLAKVSSELDEDAVAGIGEIFGISITRSMAKQEDLVGFMGDGTSTYFGMTGIVGALRKVDSTIGNIKGLKVASGNTYAEITLDDFEGVVSILPDDADDNARWYVNRKFFFSVMYNLARDAGAADMFSILTDKKDRFFMGYPVSFVSCMPSTEANSQVCAILGDLQLGAMLGERKQITIEQSKDVYFANNQIAVRGVERIDINAYGVGDTTDPGAIVGLITAAS